MSQGSFHIDCGEPLCPAIEHVEFWEFGDNLLPWPHPSSLTVLSCICVYSLISVAFMVPTGLECVQVTVLCDFRFLLL